MKHIFFLIRSFLIFLVLSLFTSHYVLALSEPPNLNTVNLRNAFSEVGTSKRYLGPNKNWHNVEEITGPSYMQTGALWYKDPLDFSEDFEGDFYLYLGDKKQFAGEGMTFIFQNNDSGYGDQCRIDDRDVNAAENKQLCALGAAGGAMGAYGMNKISPITRAIALEFDTFLNTDIYDVGFEQRGDNHIALTVPESINQGSPIEHYELKGFRCDSKYPNGLDSCLSDGTWRYIKYQWIEENQKMSYWIKNREADEDYIASFCFQFGRPTCSPPLGGSVVQPQQIVKSQNAEKYFGSNKVYWGFTGSTEKWYAQQLVAIGKIPSQLQKPLDLKVGLTLTDNNIDKSSFKASLEAFDDNQEKWNLFKPEGSNVCQDYPFENGEVHISVNGDQTAQECLELVKKYGGTEGYQKFRFIITESPAYYPQYDRYIADTKDNPIVSSQTFELNNSISGEYDFGIINTHENRWEDCPWDLNNEGMLRLNKQNATACTLGRGNSLGQVAGIPKQKVTSINFISKVQLPNEGDQFFYKFKNVQQYDNMENLDTSQATSMRDMFKSNLSLKELDLSHFNTSNVTSMESMFANLLNVETLDLSSFNTSKVTDMHSMFQIQKGNAFEEVGKNPEINLTKITFPECIDGGPCWNTQNVTTMEYMFHNQEKLISLDVFLFDTQNVEHMNSMFSGTRALTELDLSKFNTKKVTTMRNMFLNNSSLKKLDLSNFNTENVTDMENMFGGSFKIEQLDLGENFQFQPSTDKTKAGLELIKSTNMYTGGWVNLVKGKSFESSQALMKNYDGQKDSGSYTRQKRTNLSVPETINFSGLLNYNKPQSIKPSSDAKVSASSYQGNWNVVMKLGSDSDELFKNYLYYDNEQISMNDKEILTGKVSEEQELVLPLTMRLDPLASLDPLADEEYVGKLIYTLEITLIN